MSGHLYSREAIYEYLLTKKDELKETQLAYEKQQRDLAEKAYEGMNKKAQTDIVLFVEGQEKLTGGGASGSTAQPRKKRKVEKEEQEKKEQLVEYFSRQVDKESAESKRENVKRTSFWMPEFAPETHVDKIPEPPARPASPMSGRPLKLKELIPVNFCEDPEIATGPGADSKGRFICAVTKKQLANKPAVLIAKNGQVMLKSVWEEYGLPTMTCPISSKSLKAKDVIEMKASASGFAGGGAADAKHFYHCMR